MGLLLLLFVAAGPAFEELEKAYRGAVADADWAGAERIAAEMAALADERAPRFLQREFESAAEPPLRRLLFRAVASLKVPRIREWLEPFLGAEDPFFRAASLEALARIDSGAALERATELLRVDDDRRVRRAAISVLGTLGTPEAARALVLAGADLADDEKSAILGILKGSTAECVEALLPLATDPAAERRLLALVVLASRGTAAQRPVLEKAAKDPDRRVALVATLGLDRLSGAKGSSVAALLAKAKGFDEKWELLDAVSLAGIRDPALAAALAKAAKEGERALRAKSAESLGTAGGREAVAALAPLLAAERPWQLPVGAARGLRATRAAEAIPPLIAALPRANGRLGQEIESALQSLTGQPFGRSAEAWSRWWADHGASFAPPPIPPPPAGEEEASKDRYAFYGIEIRSESAAFVCDISGSMLGEKLETLRRELSTVVKRFPAAGRFQLVFFHETVLPWSKELVPATPKAKERALEAVAALSAGGATNLWDALQAGLADPGVDTLILLTDGAPTAGKIRDMNEILKRFLAGNRERMVLLHVVCIGQKSPHLRDMARVTGGRYVER